MSSLHFFYQNIFLCSTNGFKSEIREKSSKCSNVEVSNQLLTDKVTNDLSVYHQLEVSYLNFVSLFLISY